MLSDRELTDNEGPPTRSKLPVVSPSSSAQKPAVKSTDVADVSVSSHSSSQLTCPPSTVSSASVNAPAVHPASGCVVQPSREDLSHLIRPAGSGHGETVTVTTGVGDIADRSAADCTPVTAKPRKTPAGPVSYTHLTLPTNREV